MTDDREPDCACSYGAPIQMCATHSDEIERLRAALEKIAELDYRRAAVNGCAHTAVEIARAALSPPTKDEPR